MTDGLSRERQSFSYVAHELYLANIQLLGWAHSILNAESPEDGRAALLKTGDELSTWPRRAAKELLRLRARVEVLERERDDRERAFKDETLKERAEWEISVARERAAGSMWNEEAKLFRSQVAALTSQLAALEPVVEAAKRWVEECGPVVKADEHDTDPGILLVAAVDALRETEK